MVCTLIDYRNDAVKCSKLGSETTRLDSGYSGYHKITSPNKYVT